MAAEPPASPWLLSRTPRAVGGGMMLAGGAPAHEGVRRSSRRSTVRRVRRTVLRGLRPKKPSLSLRIMRCPLLFSELRRGVGYWKRGRNLEQFYEAGQGSA